MKTFVDKPKNKAGTLCRNSVRQRFEVQWDFFNIRHPGVFLSGSVYYEFSLCERQSLHLLSVPVWIESLSWKTLSNLWTRRERLSLHLFSTIQSFFILSCSKNNHKLVYRLFENDTHLFNRSKFVNDSNKIHLCLV